MFLVPSIVGVLVAGAAGPAGLLDASPPERVFVDVVVDGLEPLREPDRARVRQDVSRIWDGAGVVLRWLEPHASSQHMIRVRIDWASIPIPIPCVGRTTLGSIDMVDGHARGDTIRVSGFAATEIVRCAKVRRHTSTAWPAGLRDRFVARVLARVIAHEIGHYLLGPSHETRGLMRANLPAADLLEPLPTRYRWPTPRPPIVADRSAIEPPAVEPCSLTAMGAGAQ